MVANGGIAQVGVKHVDLRCEFLKKNNCIAGVGILSVAAWPKKTTISTFIKVTVNLVYPFLNIKFFLQPYIVIIDKSKPPIGQWRVGGLYK